MEIHDEYYLSESAYNSLMIKERYNALEVVKKLRLSTKMNRFSNIDLDLTPYLKFPVSLIGLAEVDWIFGIAPTQSGKTLLLQISIADMIDQESGTAQFIFPDAVSGRKLFEEKLLKFIEENPFLDDHVLEPRKDSLAMSGVKLDNVSIYPAFAKSPQSMNSLTCLRVFMDEIRLFPKYVKAETNPIEYGEDRTTTYQDCGRAQHYGVTTPAYEGDLMHSQIGRPFTVEYWWAHCCPLCNRWQVLDIYENFVQDPVTKLYLPHCLCKYCKKYEFNDSNKKRDLNSQGRYIKWHQQGLYYEEVGQPKHDKVVICRWTSESSPFRSFQRICDKYEKSRDDYSALNNFNQAWRARFIKRQKSNTSIEVLEERISKSIVKGVVPEWCKAITAGIDTQGNGFYFWVHAWGENKSACIDSGLIDSHYLVDTTTEPVRKKLDRYMESKIYTAQNGKRWAIGAWAIDTGGNRTQQVYNAIEDFDKCVPCKGRNKMDEAIRYTVTGKTNKLYLVNTEFYSDISDSHPFNDKWYLYKGFPTNHIKQFCNWRKEIEDKLNKRGEEIAYFKKFGQTDIRHAYIHALIAADTPIGNERIKISECLSDPFFEYNPVEVILFNKVQSVPRKKKNNKSSSPVEINSDYSDENSFTSSGFMM